MKLYSYYIIVHLIEKEISPAGPEHQVEVAQHT